MLSEKERKEVIYYALGISMLLDFLIAKLETRQANISSKFWWELISTLKLYEETEKYPPSSQEATGGIVLPK